MLALHIFFYIKIYYILKLFHNFEVLIVSHYVQRSYYNAPQWMPETMDHIESTYTTFFLHIDTCDKV